MPHPQEHVQGLRGAILVTDGVEEVEPTDPSAVLRQAGAHVDIIAPHGGQIQACKHYTPQHNDSGGHDA
jgi:protease I